MDLIRQQIKYNGTIWIKEDINILTHETSNTKEVDVKFPDESINWVWDHQLLKGNNFIDIDNIKYKIDGFCCFCYDGIMKNNSTINVIPSSTL